MDDIYREQILDHYKNPRNYGKIEKPDLSSRDSLVSCGDQLSMHIKLNKRMLAISEIKFQGSGCAISMASASMLTEYVKNKPILKLQNLTKDDILKMLGIQLTPTRLKCALLALEVLHKAINRY